MKHTFLLLFALVLPLCSCQDTDDGNIRNVNSTSRVEVKDGVVTTNPQEYKYAIRNPMKGWREYYGAGYNFPVRAEYPDPYGSMIKEYMQWNMLEDKESDGVDKIIAYSNHRWKGVEDINVKVIPRIFIVWREPWHGGWEKNKYSSNPDDINGWHWPGDILAESYKSDDKNTPITGGYFAPNFQERVKKLVAKAGEAWDNDPRVAYIEMGIIGEWGEHHDPDITTFWPDHDQGFHVENRTWIPGIEKTLGDAFTSAFKNKKVMVRYAYDFKDYEFGIYWDSWSMEKERGYDEIKKLGDRWKIQPIGGEITWDWGEFLKYKSLEEVVGNEDTRNLIIQQIRDLHCNHLGGVTWANFKDPSFSVNAEILQKAMGYRFVLSGFSYPASIKKDVPFSVSFDVTNTGSSPFYYDWPVEIALLDAKTHKKVWSKTLTDVHISKWFPGSNWNKTANQYSTPPVKNHISRQLTLDVALDGQYIIAISILDPAGMQPSLRFAIDNYFEGGQHPMGYIGVNKELTEYEINPALFYDMRADRTLKYKLK